MSFEIIILPPRYRFRAVCSIMRFALIRGTCIAVLMSCQEKKNDSKRRVTPGNGEWP